MDDSCEQTLHVCREVQVFAIPPRGPSGHVSGEWAVAARVFSGRLKVVSKGNALTIRLEDPSSDELFAMCPIPHGQRNICVEPAIDSKRNFVIRVEDPASKRHAFLGMSFQEREPAFDFISALIKHESCVERGLAAQALQGGAVSSHPSGSGPGAAQRAAAAAEVAVLYAPQAQQLALKAGQTIHVNLRRPAGALTGGTSASSSSSSSSGGLGRQAGPQVSSAPQLAATPTPGGGLRLAPPPVDLLGAREMPGHKLAQAPAASWAVVTPAPNPASAAASAGGSKPAAPAFDVFADLQQPATLFQPRVAAASQPAASHDTGWATFD